MTQSTTTEARVSTTRAGTIRLTTAQAITRYLAAQHSVRDGRRRRLIAAMLGIFGHGKVAGLGQALDEYQHELPFVQGRNEQSWSTSPLVTPRPTAARPRSRSPPR